MNPQKYPTITYTEFSRLYHVNFNAEAGEDDFLGKGGYGAVYKGWDNNGNQEVAIKRSETDRGLLEEVILGKTVPTDRNIARYLNGFRVRTESGNIDVAILQYYPKGNLDNLFFNPENTDLPSPKQTDAILIGILKGLKFLHEGFLNSENKFVRIVHRDLKPHNILIAYHRGEYIPLITDFGISKAIVDGDEARQKVELSTGRGTGVYKSPEQIKGVGTAFHSNLDLWAFGVMLFKILKKRLPFYSDFPAGSDAFDEEIRLKIVQSDLEEIYAQVSDQPDKYQKVIRRCLVRDIKERVQSAVELIDILEEIPEKFAQATQWLKNGEYEKAKEGFEQLLILRDGHEEARRLLAQCELMIRQENEIKEKLRTAKNYIDEERYEEARNLYVSVLSIDGGNEEARESLVKCEELIKKANERIERERQIREFIGFANDFFAKKSYSSARSSFENVLAIDPENADALEGIKKCMLKIAEAEQGTDPHEPVQVVKPVMQPDPPTDEAVVFIPPVIKNFSINPNPVKLGDLVTLTWKVEGDSEKVSLRSSQLDLERSVAKSDSLSMLVRQDAELVLEVSYQGGSIVQKNRVEVIVPVVVDKKPINKLVYLIPVLVALFLVGIVVIPRLTGMSAQDIENKRRTDGLKADSLFAFGERQLSEGIDKDIVSETYFKKAVELKPSLAGRAYDIFSARAVMLQEDSLVSANYQRLANEYLNRPSQATDSK